MRFAGIAEPDLMRHSSAVGTLSVAPHLISFLDYLNRRSSDRKHGLFYERRCDIMI